MTQKTFGIVFFGILGILAFIAMLVMVGLYSFNPNVDKDIISRCGWGCAILFAICYVITSELLKINESTNKDKK
jgi:uncharacterized BrkB/YihY/UPF0761 family membrane protein